MADYLIALVVFPALLTGWVFVQHMARRFAMKHPELGPAKEEGAGCGKSCGCSSGTKCASVD